MDPRKCPSQSPPPVMNCHLKASAESGSRRPRWRRGECRQSDPPAFTSAEKLRILKKADACLASGQRGALGAMLREEGIYSSHLATWRTLVAEASNAALADRKPGRKAKLDAKDRRIAELEVAEEALEQLVDARTDRILIVDRGRLLGLLSGRDLVKWLSLRGLGAST